VQTPDRNQVISPQMREGLTGGPRKRETLNLTIEGGLLSHLSSLTHDKTSLFDLKEGSRAFTILDAAASKAGYASLKDFGNAGTGANWNKPIGQVADILRRQLAADFDRAVLRGLDVEGKHPDFDDDEGEFTPRLHDESLEKAEQFLEMSTPMSNDFQVTNHGSIVLLEPITPAAKEWAQMNLPDDVQMFGRAIAVEPRYIHDIMQGIQGDGLTVGSGRSHVPRARFSVPDPEPQEVPTGEEI
jgi:hypothetical protein